MYGPTGLLVLVAVGYTIAAPYRPALTSALPLVAGEDGLASANAHVSTVRQVMTFVGPLVGAVLVAAWSPTAAFVVDAASFLVAAVLLASIPALSDRFETGATNLAEQRHQWRRDLTTGWSDIRAATGLSVVTMLVFAMYVARGAELVLFILVAEEQLGLGTAGIGLLTGAVGLGAIAAVPAATRLAKTDHTTAAMTVSLATTAVPLAALAAIQSTPAACLVLTVLGAGLVVFEVLSVVMLQRLTRPRPARSGLRCRRHGEQRRQVARGDRRSGPRRRRRPLGRARVDRGVGRRRRRSGGAGTHVGARTVRERRDQLRPVTDVLSRLGIFDGASTAVLERVASSIRVEFVAGRNRRGAPG